MSGTVVVTRAAPSGGTVRLTVPRELGGHRWFATTRLVGDRTVRQFTIAPVGQHRVIPSKIMPGATRTELRTDLVLFEAADRANSCLVWIGRYHEATTWFGGPPPDASGLGRLVGAVRFADGRDGAVLRPRLPQYVRQYGTTLIGSGPRSLLMVRHAAEGLAVLPAWAGLTLTGGELWRAARTLDEVAAQAVHGTVHQWRYLWASPTCVVDVVLHGPESGAPHSDLDPGGLRAVLDRLTAVWKV